MDPRVLLMNPACAMFLRRRMQNTSRLNKTEGIRPALLRTRRTGRPFSPPRTRAKASRPGGTARREREGPLNGHSEWALPSQRTRPSARVCRQAASLSLSQGSF
ncbi:hypothetical protein AAFF_G00201880 [Aldrovandia affinis]|uniref:Uncharacterized protein n=1 Tax=Aldrovandia affinis TaxID=143900 RepID=A0AAD7SWR8_9TELE|nr:hypothetical protein AAFF_G00201880 [Aldrovandia affinis]